MGFIYRFLRIFSVWIFKLNAIVAASICSLPPLAKEISREGRTVTSIYKATSIGDFKNQENPSSKQVLKK
ncbi:MAG: hypothetical protein J7501_02485 [Bdellovibrio sp.]|nr:hypothetical protein [Bdellovibrio sp.]